MRNTLYRTSGAVSVLAYIILAYQIWHLCQYGGVRSHLPALAAAFLIFAAGGSFWLVTGRKLRREKSEENISHKNRRELWLGLAVMLIVTIYFGGRIIYSAVPYNGALSWKLQEWKNKKKVELIHNNFFETGAEGVLQDLDEALDLPEKLYVTDQFRLTFNGDGEIQEIETFLYGRDESGDTQTYLVDYDVDDGEDMNVWMNGYANTEFNEDKNLAPMLRILEDAPCEEQIAAWEQMGAGNIYEILYLGRRSFQTETGLHILSGDADGDSVVSGSFQAGMLSAGGEVEGYEVSLHIPDAEEITPVRYMMEPEYISPEQIAGEQEQQQTEEAKEAESWTVDSSDGSMRYFLDEQHGWMLKITDAALGSRFYELNRTEDGGTTWETVNTDPFAGNMGVAEGLQFYDENFGFAALTGASQSSSRMYMTKDGGSTFTEILLPMDTVTELPENAQKLGYSLENYAYLCMPEKNGEVWTIDVLAEAAGSEGLRFRSEDRGATWVYEGTF